MAVHFYTGESRVLKLAMPHGVPWSAVVEIICECPDVQALSLDCNGPVLVTIAVRKSDKAEAVIAAMHEDWQLRILDLPRAQGLTLAQRAYESAIAP